MGVLTEIPSYRICTDKGRFDLAFVQVPVVSTPLSFLNSEMNVPNF